MLIRSVQILFISFWLVTMGVLVKSVFWPTESGMVEIDPRRAFQSFLDWSSSSRFKLYQNNKEMGVLSVSTSRHSLSKPARLTLSANFNGQVERPIFGMLTNAWGDFNQDLSFRDGVFVVRIPSQDMTVRIAADSKEQLNAEVKVAGQSIFSYTSGENDQVDPMLKGMVASNPMMANLLASTQGMDKNLSIKGYHGIYHFKKRRLPVFLIKIATANDAQHLRIFFSKAGDPLLVESNFGVYAVSELFSSFESMDLDR